MAAEVDEATSAMTFLYRFLPGLCPASHGHNVARLAGLPARVLQEAAAKSAEFERGEVANAKSLDAACDTYAEAARLAALGDEAGLRELYRRHLGESLATQGRATTTMSQDNRWEEWATCCGLRRCGRGVSQRRLSVPNSVGS